MRTIISCFISAFCFCSCATQNNNAADHKNLPSSSQTITDSSANASEEEPERLPLRFLGIYSGLQPGYNLRNANGEEMEVRGEKVPVPPCEYKFIIKQNNEVTLQQLNLENKRSILYKGTYTMASEDINTYSLTCTLNDGDDSAPVYIIEISKTDKSATCYGTGEPEFKLYFGTKPNTEDTVTTDSSKSDSAVKSL